MQPTPCTERPQGGFEHKTRFLWGDTANCCTTMPFPTDTRYIQISLERVLFKTKNKNATKHKCVFYMQSVNEKWDVILSLRQQRCQRCVCIKPAPCWISSCHCSNTSSGWKSGWLVGDEMQSQWNMSSIFIMFSGHYRSDTEDWVDPTVCALGDLTLKLKNIHWLWL